MVCVAAHAAPSGRLALIVNAQYFMLQLTLCALSAGHNMGNLTAIALAMPRPTS